MPSRRVSRSRKLAMAAADLQPLPCPRLPTRPPICVMSRVRSALGWGSIMLGCNLICMLGLQVDRLDTAFWQIDMRVEPRGRGRVLACECPDSPCVALVRDWCLACMLGCKSETRLSRIWTRASPGLPR